MARNSREYRDVDGVLILDKPVGLSSNQALQQLRRLYRARKAGHCGSLDPLASGVLPVCLGQATRYSSYLLGAHKTYRATCQLGQTTTTGDAEGEVIDRKPVATDRQQVTQVLQQFIGQIEQVPPMYSALKHQGRRLYQLAREGKEVEREPRRVEIFEFELLAFDGDKLEIEVCCSKGTYIRTLAEDIGKLLGCGAHLYALRRSAVDSLLEQDSITLERLQQLASQDLQSLDQLLLPVTAALTRFAELQLNAGECLEISHGKRIKLDEFPGAGLYRLVSGDGAFIGLGEVGPDAELTAKRLMNTAR